MAQEITSSQMSTASQEGNAAPLVQVLSPKGFAATPIETFESLFAVRPEDKRRSFEPVFRHDIYKLYEAARDNFWIPNEIYLQEDAIHYTTKLNKAEQQFVKFILAFFAMGDGIINENLAARMKDTVKFQESSYFYNLQAAMEDIHAHTYSKLLDEIISDPHERDEVFDNILQRKSIQDLLNYMRESAAAHVPFAEYVLRSIFGEGVFFTGCFCVIYWLGSRGLMPGLCQANQLIARDEGLHTSKSTLVYNLLLVKLTPVRVGEMAHEARRLTVAFLADGLREGQPNMNIDLLTQFVEQTIDERLVGIGVGRIYKTTHQFHFMNNINLVKKGNFFERPITDYKQTEAPSASVQERLDDY
jgi:ribonucleoside-diphosphate reductase subunit M2